MGNNTIIATLYQNGVVKIEHSGGCKEYYWKKDLVKMENNYNLIIEPFEPYSEDFGVILSRKVFENRSLLKVSELE